MCSPSSRAAAPVWSAVRRGGNAMFRLDGKVALVTGSNRGLGAAIALGFAQAGADVVLHDIAAPEETAKRIGEKAGVRTHCLAADLSSRAQADRVIEEAVAAMGAVDILVNNAGIIRRAPAVEHSDDDWDAVIEINLTAVFRLSRAAGAHMLPRGRGKIVNIASLLSFQGGINVPSYSAAKMSWRCSCCVCRFFTGSTTSCAL